MRLVIVEDDHMQSEVMVEAVRNAFPSAEIMPPIQTERAFYAWLDTVTEDLPDLFIIDIMLPWTTTDDILGDPEQSIPDQVRREGVYTAGLRCQARLQQKVMTRHLPVLLYSVLEQDDLKPVLDQVPAHVYVLSKSSDTSPLIQEISRHVTAS